MSLNPYKLHRSIISSMRVTICSSGMCSDSKYSKAAGSVILLRSGFFKSSKSIPFKPFLVKTSFPYVCSNPETLTPLSELSAPNAIKQLTESFIILLPCTICLNVHKYVYLLFIIFIYFMRIKFIDS